MSSMVRTRPIGSFNVSDGLQRWPFVAVFGGDNHCGLSLLKLSAIR